VAETNAKDDRSSILNEYEQRNYEELSQEFKELYPSAARAFELIPLMYNRLTLVDGLTHKEAFTKIHNDHNHLSGFTERNIRRYLPIDNPHIPRRVRTSCPRNSITEFKDFEFSLEWDSVRNYMGDLDSTLKVWFNGELDKRTGKVISAYTGRTEDRDFTSKGSREYVVEKFFI
jgi:hypothetical protein